MSAATPTPAQDRMPPHSELAEASVLGSILLDDVASLDVCTDYGITADAFYVPTHRLIYEAARAVAATKRPVDITTLEAHLREAGKLEQVGGQQFLQRLIDDTPTSRHAEYYADIVASKWRLRRLVDECRKTEADCFEMQGESPDELLAGHRRRMVEIETATRFREDSWSEIVTRSMNSVEAVLDGGVGLLGISTGFRNIDNATLGLKPGEVTILAARPSMGKTSLAMNIAENVALAKLDAHDTRRHVGIFSLEMTAEALALRMKCSHASVSSWSFTRRMTQGIGVRRDYDALAASASVLRKAPLHVDDTGGLDIQQLRLRARRWKARHDVALMIVDYIQLLHDRENARNGREREIAAISAQLKAAAKELHVPFLVLSQFSRKPEDRGGKPKLSDLRDSGSLEQDADNVWLLRRPAKCDEDETDKTLAVIDVAKQRNGPTGDVFLNFREEYTRFEDRIRSMDMYDGEAAQQEQA